ncbi:MAG: DUF547 domain-containing protein [Terriglobia bacterium]
MASRLRFVKRKVALAAALSLVAAALAPLAAQEPAPAFETAAFARALAQFVTPEGWVRYAALKRNPADLDAFIEQLAATSPESHPALFPSPQARMAYWINAYNAFVLYAIVQAYPVDSVRDFRFGFGLLFFKRSKFVAGGKHYSLDAIEHGILRKQFAEPRVHFVVNCASTSCPRLLREPIRARTLDQQLQAAARGFIGDKANVRLEGDTLRLSKIFDWYEGDFLKDLEADGAEDPHLADYVARYLPAPQAERLRRHRPRVKYIGYDWSLNDAARHADGN